MLIQVIWSKPESCDVINLSPGGLKMQYTALGTYGLKDHYQTSSIDTQTGCSNIKIKFVHSFIIDGKEEYLNALAMKGYNIPYIPSVI